MLCIKKIWVKQFFISLFIIILLNGCGEGIQSGSTTVLFSGVKSVVALSPTSVKINWIKKDGIKEYSVFKSTQTTPLITTALDFVVIENLDPSTNYTFKVEGSDGSKSYGSETELKVTTWPRFNGIEKVQIDPEGNAVVSWSYEQSPLAFEIYYQKDTAPSAATTNNWTEVKLSTDQKQATISNLEASSKYYFMVHAKYREGESEITSVSISANTLTSFATPTYILESISIGGLPTMRVTPVQDASHSIQFFSSTVYYEGNAISDPLIGSGSIVFNPTANLPLGKIENLTLKVEYTEPGKSESMSIEGLSTFLKGISPIVESPPIESFDLGPAYLGKAMTSGDFNCDGADDLAIGLPDVSSSILGMSSPRSGMVVIYYSVYSALTNTYSINKSPQPSLNPVNLGVDPQIIAFTDLNESANFGASLASGNLNNDRNGLNPCEDLIVGAPYATNPKSNHDDGNAFIFFGSTKGASSSTKISDMAGNASTCNGDLAAAICAPVRLYEDRSATPISLTGAPTPIANYSDDGGAQFGRSVTFVGDFNADGYEDIVIGAPSSDFDGDISNYDGRISNAGAVHFYFGSRYGLGYEYPGTAGIPDESSAKVRSLKVYAPIPLSNAYFGMSVAGGADIDGGYKINLSGSGPLVGGGDLVVGAPGFYYSNYIGSHPLSGNIHTSPSLAGIVAHPSGNDGWWKVNGINLSAGSNFYGIPQNNSTVGAAFVYFGRHGSSSSPPTETPSRQSFWACGSRSLSPSEHYSCLVKNQDVKMLTPRNSSTRGFGSAVAILGNRSRFKDNSTSLLTDADANPLVPREYFSDANSDGYADVVVSAPTTTVSSKANVGVLWQFFGNSNQLMDTQDLFNVFGDGSPVPTKDFRINDPTCSGFINSSSGVKQACLPVLLQSSSLSAESKLGTTHNNISRGDVTGDGLMDLAVGVPGDNVIGSGSGAALIFTSVANLGLTSNYKKIYTSESGVGNSLGTSVVLGNFNGDFRTEPPISPTTVGTIMHYYDIFSGAPNDEFSRYGGGAIYGFLSQNLSLPSVVNTHSEVIVDEMASIQEYGMGESRLIGDINGDGYDDAFSKIKSVLSSGQVKLDAVIYFGSSLGLITTNYCLQNQIRIFGQSGNESHCYPKDPPSNQPTLKDIALPQLLPHPPNLDSQWSFRADAAGDVNGDGFGDVLFFGTMSSSNRKVIVYFGGRGGLQNVIDPSWTPSIGDPQIVSGDILSTPYQVDIYSLDHFNLRMPITVADFNGDGYSDFIYGDPWRQSSSINTPSNNLLPRAEPGFPAGVTAGSGWACGGSSLTECTSGKSVEDFGRIWVFYGSSRGYQTPKNNSVSSLDVDSATNGVINGYDTESGATKPCSTNTSPDPTCQVTHFRNPVLENILFGYGKFNHRFGFSVTTSDVNKDGYPDLLVGAPLYEDLSCWTGANSGRNLGRIYIYYGSQFGLLGADTDSYYNHDLLATCPVDPASDPASGLTSGSATVRALTPTLSDYGISNNITGREFGYSLSSAGDLNADGYEDIAVSSPDESTPGQSLNGSTYIYYGPICPADNEANVTEAFQRQDGTTNNLNRQMYFNGQAPAGASPADIFTGTLNAAISSSCFRGTASKMKPMPQKFLVFGSLDSEYWGRTLLGGPISKGDFNNDGYDDLIIGSDTSGDIARNLTQLGRAVVFFGSQNGLFTNDYPSNSLALNFEGTNFRPYLINPFNYPSGSRFFKGNSSRGDINGDGTMDIMATSQYYNGTGSLRGILIGTFFVLY